MIRFRFRLSRRSQFPLFSRHVAHLIIVFIFFLSGCSSTVALRDPVAKFQDGVNATVAVVQPYFIQLNRVEVEYQLYMALYEKKDWGTQNVAPRFKPEAIAARLQALTVISAYALLLGDFTNSKEPEDLKQAASSLGKNVKELQERLKGLSIGTDFPDISGPLSALTTLVGQIVIETKQRDALMQAVLSGDESIRTIIDLLKSDLDGVLALKQTALSGIQTVKLKLYNDARAKSSPTDLVAMIDEVSRTGVRIQILQTVQVEGILQDMRIAHQALVTYAKSCKRPRDLRELASRVEVFAGHATLIANTIYALRSLP